MAIMPYEVFKNIFNETIFEKSKADLLIKIAENPSRYIGIFRPTKPKAKILQNLLQSHEIRFGDAFEILFEEYFKILNCEMLDKKIVHNDEVLNIDQCFKKDGKIYFIEQKVRDDHDSTKKRGQINNFEKKLEQLVKKYQEKLLIGVFYFLDPQLLKNKRYYINELKRISEVYGVDIYLFYGEELFNFLGFKGVWEEIINYLKKWKEDIPQLPEINFDIDAQHTFQEIKDLDARHYRKLFADQQIVNEILLTLFPQKKTLSLLKNYFIIKRESVYRNLAENITRLFSID